MRRGSRWDEMMGFFFLALEKNETKNTKVSN